MTDEEKKANMAEYRKVYYQKNKAKSYAYTKKYYKENKEQCREYSKKYALKNVEKLKAARDRDRAKIRIMQREYMDRVYSDPVLYAIYKNRTNKRTEAMDDLYMRQNIASTHGLKASWITPEFIACKRASITLGRILKNN